MIPGRWEQRKIAYMRVTSGGLPSDTNDALKGPSFVDAEQLIWLGPT